MKQRNFTFTDTDRGSFGTMQCVVCGKEITQGEYMVYEEWEDGDLIAYRTQHLNCALTRKDNIIRYADHLKIETDKIREKLESAAKVKKEAIVLIKQASSIEIDGDTIYLN